MVEWRKRCKVIEEKTVSVTKLYSCDKQFIYYLKNVMNTYMKWIYVTEKDDSKSIREKLFNHIKRINGEINGSLTC